MCPPSVPPSRAPEGLGCSSVGWGAPVLFFLMPGHSISVWWPLVKPPLPAPELSVPVSGRGQHVTDREGHVGALEIFKIISYKLLHCDPKALQEPGWDAGNAVVGTRRWEHVRGGGACGRWQRLCAGTELCTSTVTRVEPAPSGTEACLRVQPLRLL